MKKLTAVCLALFVSSLIILEPDSITAIMDVALKAFGKESAKIEAKKN